MWIHPANLDPRRLVWNLARFGITPARLVRRLSGRCGTRVLCICIPKAGTHLLERILCLHPCLARTWCRTIRPRYFSKARVLRLISKLRRGRVLFAHQAFDADILQAARQRGIKVLFMIRDPRDVVISSTDFIERVRAHPFHDRYMQESNRRDRYLLTINGDPSAGLSPLARTYRNYGDWLDQADLTIKFETLIDDSGCAQAETLVELFKTLGLPVAHPQAEQMAAQTVSKQSLTFNRGTKGRWRERFDPELLQAFTKSAHDILVRYGYETRPVHVPGSHGGEPPLPRPPDGLTGRQVCGNGAAHSSGGDT